MGALRRLLCAELLLPYLPLHVLCQGLWFASPPMLLQLRTRMLLQLLLPLSVTATKASRDATDGGERSAFNASSSLQAYDGMSHPVPQVPQYSPAGSGGLGMHVMHVYWHYWHRDCY